VGSRVKFTNGTRGIIGLERDAEAKDRAPSLDKYFIDTGATNAKDSSVRVGDAVVYDSLFYVSGERIIVNSLHSRMGVALLIEFLRDLKTSPHEIYCVFTVQKEMGGRGAGPAAFGIEPDIGLAIDVASTSDTPNVNERTSITLGKGPAIKVKDKVKENTMIADPALVDFMIHIAQKNRIPYQFDLARDLGTDAYPMQVSGFGARVGGISVPVRYLHSPSEMVDLRDMNKAQRLLVALLHSKEL